MEKAKSPAGPAEKPRSAADGMQGADKARGKRETILTLLVGCLLLAGLAVFLLRRDILPGKREGIDPPPLPAEESAAEPTPEPPSRAEGEWAWNLENGVLSVTGEGNMTNYSYFDEQPWLEQREEITRVVIENRVTGIGDYAFMDFPGLTSVQIPDSVISIGDSAFAYCLSLSSVRIPDSVTSIGDSAFWGSGLSAIEIPDSVTSIGAGAFSCCGSLAGLEADPGNPRYRSIGGALFTKDGQTLLCCPAGIGGTEYAIPAGVTSIGDSAFWGCGCLTSIEIPDSVTSIGAAAFEDCCLLIAVRIPDSVRSIGGDAFRGCDRLTAVDISSNVTSIGEGTFAFCGSLADVKIPAGVTRIESGAFSGCSRLAEVSYSGTEEQWEAISVGDGNEALLQAAIRFGDPGKDP